ncbi:sigma-70 family RNA polymerase sigma factor [Nocardiopsis algeriensis]|uniref:RNA polymerase sigma factor (Sigma-70 family) n=1 Tax=Nocardiopsis algeriensis TaxID=1478215 RepID=A0A841IKF0_9ACTN|nr:RNA polymerase sigma factor (sigma-70 family) [Nocardiopsis algeriensis]
MPGDAELVRRARRGEYPAWEAIVDRHLPMVNAVARSYGLAAPDREDVVQTVWLTLNQHLARLRSPERLRGWLRRVTRDMCRRQRERDARHHPVDPGALAALPRVLGQPSPPSPEDEYLRKEVRDELHRAIRRIADPGERRAALHYLRSRYPRGGDSVPGPGGDPGAAANQRRRMFRTLRRILEESR